MELFIIRVKFAIHYFLNTVRHVAARLRAKSSIYDCLIVSYWQWLTSSIMSVQYYKTNKRVYYLFMVDRTWNVSEYRWEQFRFLRRPHSSVLLPPAPGTSHLSRWSLPRHSRRDATVIPRHVSPGWGSRIPPTSPTLSLATASFDDGIRLQCNLERRWWSAEHLVLAERFGRCTSDWIRNSSATIHYRRSNVFFSILPRNQDRAYVTYSHLHVILYFCHA